MFNFFEEMQEITRQYCELNGLPVPKLYPCANINCWSRVEKKGALCPACATRLDGQITDAEERGE